MIVNSTLALFHRESSGSAFVLSSNPLHLVFADGTSDDPSTTVDNGSPNTVHDTSSVPVLFSIPGQVKAIWSPVTGGQTFQREENYFVSYYDIIGQVRDVFRVNATALPDEDVDEQLVQLVADLEESYPTCFPYRDLVGQDQYWCDRGLGFTVAACLLAQNPGRFIGGPVKAVRDAQIRYEFAIQPYAKNAQTRAEELLGQGWTEIQRISCIAALNKANPSLLYAATGPRRGTYSWTPDLTGNEHIPLITGLIRNRMLI